MKKYILTILSIMFTSLNLSAQNVDNMLVRISEIEIHSQYLDEYLQYAYTVGATSVNEEQGVICIYPMQTKRDSCQIRILEIYASQEAYQHHIKTAHFQKYKTETLHMVKTLDLVDMKALDAATMPHIFTKMASVISNKQSEKENKMKNIGSVLALYPTPTVVIGTMVEGKVNWMLASHVGIMCHDHIMVSLFQKHFTNKGIKENMKFSVNIVDEALLPKADYVGTVSGEKTDKSKVFEYFIGDGGAPVIKDASLVMECKVENNYELNNFDNFICSIIDTYANEDILNEKGKIDYDELKPVLFEMPTYTYLRTGERIGKCKTLGKSK